uniref:Uncharacterized protein MANES_16G014000 n=1 Tax=Rhizophora mucronata TaxID=61149 RepID=A0A2P2MV99_RHIMU
MSQPYIQIGTDSNFPITSKLHFFRVHLSRSIHLMDGSSYPCTIIKPELMMSGIHSIQRKVAVLMHYTLMVIPSSIVGILQ